MTYPVRVIRAVLLEARHVVRAETPTHGALRDRLAGVALVTLVVDLICAALGLVFERGVAQTDIHTFGSALFWSTTQLLTVSSQIHNPLSVGGRLLDVFMEAYAMIVVATITGSIGAFLVQRARELEHDARRAHEAKTGSHQAPGASAQGRPGTSAG